ncbi:MAG TPA: hypothetical protein VEQ58_22625, partial [Polyangiaceae bacterium]|nr:hypothetical protein [Polyangiaceae bacterium]
PADGGWGGNDSEPPVPAVPPIDARYVKFNHDGSKLKFDGILAENARSGAYIVDLKPHVSAPHLVVSGAPAGADTSCSSWSPDGALLICHWATLDGAAYFVADADGGEPITIGDGEFYSSWTWSPSPSQRRLFADTYQGSPQLVTFDLAHADHDPVVIMSSLVPYAVAPDGKKIGFFSPPNLSLVNLSAPEHVFGSIATQASKPNAVTWAWSPDGNFIAAADGRQQLLARVDGDAVSTAIALKGISTPKTVFGWQP